MDGDAGSTEKSTYNEAGLQIQRLHNLWVKIQYASSNRELIKWKYLLDDIWLELVADVYRDAKKDDIIAENKELKNDICDSKNRDFLYEKIMARHAFLKRLQDSCGKGGSYRDSDSDDFE